MHRRSLIAAAGLALLDARPAWSQEAEEESLDNRGAPRGRVGGATRGEPRGGAPLALDLVAPLHGAGVTSLAAPRLFYIVSTAIPEPLRLTVTLRGRAAPLVDAALPAAPRGGLYAVATAVLGLRLEPGRLHVWSIAASHDPAAPSNDLVASALLQYTAAPPTLDQVVREAGPANASAVLAKAGYWYDAFAAAEGLRSRDGAVALAAMLKAEKLDAAMSAAARQSAQ